MHRERSWVRACGGLKDPGQWVLPFPTTDGNRAPALGMAEAMFNRRKPSGSLWFSNCRQPSVPAAAHSPGYLHRSLGRQLLEAALRPTALDASLLHTLFSS